MAGVLCRGEFPSGVDSNESGAENEESLAADMVKDFGKRRDIGYAVWGIEQLL